MILINITFLTDDERHGDSISFHWPAAPGIGEAINLYTGPYQGKYRVIGALWEPTIDWTGNVQNMSLTGCSVTLAVRRIGDPKPAPADDLARAFIEVNEMASRQRQDLFNARADLRDAQTQLRICRDQWEEMRKQRDAVMERASISLTRAEQAERALANCQHNLSAMENKVKKAEAALAAKTNGLL